MLCTKHKSYKAKRPPTADCEQCQRAYRSTLSRPIHKPKPKPRGR